jgi:hypothetical protein
MLARALVASVGMSPERLPAATPGALTGPGQGLLANIEM